MQKIILNIILEKPDEKVASIIKKLTKEFFREFFHGADISIRFTHVADLPSINCVLYIREISWDKFFHVLQLLKGHIEEQGTQVIQQIVASEPPVFELLIDRKGLWVDAQWVFESMDRELMRFIETNHAENINQQWFFLPFKPDSSNQDDQYEICPPDERIKKVGTRINGSKKRSGAPIGIRLRTSQGYRLSEYIDVVFCDIIKSESNLGGNNVILTTVLQMNDKLSLVNHYSEKSRDCTKLDLFSLPAMNLSITDEREETNIANLVSSGKLVVKDIKLGE